jgi:hypothetical protein
MATAPAEGMRPPRGISGKIWLLVVVLSVAGLVTVLIGVALLADDGDPCSCSPVRRPSASTEQ